MAQVKVKVAAGHCHLFHRAAPTIAKHKGCFEAEDLDVEISATGMTKACGKRNIR